MLTEQQQRQFWTRVDKSGDCWLWTAAKNDRGYGQLSINRVLIYAHRIAYSIIYGDIPDGMFVCHTCDNPSCCNPSHLFLGTHIDNMRDMRTKGRGNKGERHGMAKLTWEQVHQIRQYAQQGHTRTKIAQWFGVDQSTVSDIVNNRIWRED